MEKSRTAFGLILFVMVLLSAGLAVAIYPADAHGGEKVTICHATESETNPYVRIVVSKNAIGGHFDNQGNPLKGHEQDILYPGVHDCPKPPTPTATEEPTWTATATATDTPKPEPSDTPTAAVSDTPSPTLTPTSTPTPTSKPPREKTPTQTWIPWTPQPSRTPTVPACIPAVSNYFDYGVFHVEDHTCVVAEGQLVCWVTCAACGCE